MVRAGWVRGAIAIESGSDFIRNAIMGKRLSDEKIREAVRIIRKHPQVWLKAYFIVGMPEETEETLRQTYEMIEELELDEPQVTNAMPLPGTELYAQCLRDGLLLEMQPELMWCDQQLIPVNDTERFFLRPYQLSIDALLEWRSRLDQLVITRKATSAERARRIRRSARSTWSGEAAPRGIQHV
jgi:radical SAM superfamily enzyme YgiQ (UPF0313 family)